VKVRLELKTDPQSCGWIELAVFDADSPLADPQPIARADGATLRNAVCKLVAVFKEMQDATIEALDASGLVRFADDVITNVALSPKPAGEAS
jgi:hypothetical protein